jgi:hypothetical protein
LAENAKYYNIRLAVWQYVWTRLEISGRNSQEIFRMPADERKLVSSIRRILVLELSPAREYNNVKQIKAKSLKRRTTMDIKEKSTSKDKLLKICVTAMFAALICVATMLIQIPSPLNGYVNFGDCFILIAAWVLGPVYGFAAGGIGSALADLFTGYVHYVPGTFVIKGLIAVAAALICRAMLKKIPKISVPAYIVSALAGEIIMVGGYYLYAALLLGKSFAGAAASVPGNLVQGAFGLVCGVVIIKIIAKTRVLNKFSTYAVQ